MDISLVIPVYNEENNIGPLSDEIHETMRATSLSYEIIFVDDGSTDGTARELENLSGKKTVPDKASFKHCSIGPHQGKSRALAEGFRQSSGNIVITIDGDLQDDPREIPALIHKLNEGYDMVSGWKSDRQDPWTKIWASRLFNRVTSFVTGIPLHDFGSGFKAYRRKALSALCFQKGMHRYLPVFVHAAGFRVAEISYHHRVRRHGKSKFGVFRIIEGAVSLVQVLWITKLISKHSSGISVSSKEK